MKTKNLFRLFFVGGAAALAVLSCSTKEQAVKGYNVADFAVDVASTTATTVTAKVTVTNNDAAPWYAFATTDLESKATDLVAAELGNLTVSTKILNTGSKDVTLSGLIPGGVHYRVIVTGLAPDGRTYGTPAEAEFRTGMDYGVREDWAVEFLGTSVEEGEYINYFQISGTAEEDQFSYIVVPASVYAEMGAEEIICSDVEAVLAAGAAADVTYSGDDYYTWDLLEAGDYVFVMYGVDKDFNPTMEYTAHDFTIEEASDLYNAFLGNWFTEEGDMYTIEPETINQSFYFSGLYSIFEPQNGLIVFDVVNLGSGVYVLGIDGDGKVVTSGPLGYGQISEDGETIDFVGLNGVVEITALQFTGRSFEPVGAPELMVPVTLSKTQPEPTEEYSAWIGTWYDEGSNEFEIKEGIINHTLLLSGLVPDMDVELQFDEASGDISIYHQQITEDDEGYIICLMGKDQENYLEDAEQAEDTYLLATAKMAADGTSFDVTGNEYQATYGTTTYDEIITALGIFATDGKGNWYSLEDGVLFAMGTYYDQVPEPSEEYLAWIGSWEVTRGSGEDEITDTWTISEKKVNSAYTVTGVEGTSFEVEASFDKASGALSIKDQDIYEVADEEDNVLMTVALMGSIEYGGESMLIGQGDDLFFATLGTDGSVTVEANLFYGYFPYTEFRLYAIIGADEMLSTYSAVGYSIPFTMTAAEEPAEGDSVHSLSFPVRPEQWTATEVKRYPDNGKVSTKSVDNQKLKTRNGKALAKDKKVKEYQGEAPKQSKTVNGKVNFGGGKRGKLNK